MKKKHERGKVGGRRRGKGTASPTITKGTPPGPMAKKTITKTTAVTDSTLRPAASSWYCVETAFRAGGRRTVSHV